MNFSPAFKQFFRAISLIALILALLNLIDLVSFTDLGGFIDFASVRGIFLLVYTLTFLVLFLGIIISVYLVISYLLERIFARQMALDHELRIHAFFLWLLLVVYYGWLIRERVLLLQALSPLWIIVVYFFLLVFLFFFAIRLPGKKSSNELIASTLSAIGLLLLIRLIYFVLDASFFTPVNRQNISWMVITLILLLSGGLILYRPLYRTLCCSIGKHRYINALLNLPLIVVLLLAVTTVIGIVYESRGSYIPHHPPNSVKRSGINIILIVIDALRADHLGCYGYPLKTSPNLDALAREGVRFDECYTPVSWTKPSVASLMTSLYPGEHGAVRGGDILPGEVVTLAELFREEGWNTAGFVTNPHLKSDFNYNQGFDLFDDSLTRDKIFEIAIRELPFYFVIRSLSGKTFDLTDRDRADLLNRKVFSWLELNQEGNFFAYLHYMDPHAPYDPPGEYRQIFPALPDDDTSRALSLYDGEIRFADNAVGELIEHLKVLGIYDRTAIIVTSDHGEAFGEHGDFGHGHTIYQDQLHVPLIISYPSSPSGIVVSSPVSTLDILPTLLDLIVSRPAPVGAGASLTPMMEENEPVPGDKGDLYFDLENFNGSAVISGVIKDGRWKYIRTEKSPLRLVEPGEEEEL